MHGLCADSDEDDADGDPDCAGRAARDCGGAAHTQPVDAVPRGPGFRSDQVVSARIGPNNSVCGDADRCLTFYRLLEEQADAAPGTTGVALVSTPPLGGLVAKRSLELEGVPETAKRAPLFWLNVVSPITSA